jgi:CRISPR-associated endonuclease/helicase Cas3
VWQGEQSRVVLPDRLRPGQTIVVPAAYGGIEHGNWAPASPEPVTDVAELAALASGRRPALRFHAGVVSALFGETTDPPRPESDDSEGLDDRAVVLDWLGKQLARAGGAAQRDLLEKLFESGRSLRVERLRSMPGDGEDEFFLAVGRRGGANQKAGPDDRATTGGSMSSFTGVEVSLVDHLAGVVETISALAERAGAPGLPAGSPIASRASGPGIRPARGTS